MTIVLACDEYARCARCASKFVAGIRFASTELGISAERMKVNATNSVRVGVEVSQYGWETGMPDPALMFSTTVMDVYLVVVSPCFSFAFAFVEYCCWYR
jgi:positive regulator of sigma E activity